MRSPLSVRTLCCRSGSCRTTWLRWVRSSDPSNWCYSRRRGEQGFFRYTGPGKAQRRYHQRLFWQMYCLDRAVPLLVADGLLPEGTRGYAVPDGAEVGLLLLLPGDGAAVSGELRARLGPYLARASRLPDSEHRRWLAVHDCTVSSLIPSQIRTVPLADTAARASATLNRAQLYERFWPQEPR